MFRGYGHRQKLTPEQTAHNAKVKAAREAAAMTCQCCPGKVLANTGVIAHHGYQRPGDGWQTASCHGARRLPFEVERTALGEVIDALRNSIKGARATRRDIVAEKRPITREFTDYSGQRDARNRWPSIEIEFTRLTFDDQRTMHATILTRNGFYATSFDDVKKSRLAEQDQRIKHLVSDLNRCCAKYEGWSITHEWVPGPAGVKLMPALAVSKDSLGGWRKLRALRADPEGGIPGRKP